MSRAVRGISLHFYANQADRILKARFKIVTVINKIIIWIIITQFERKGCHSLMMSPNAITGEKKLGAVLILGFDSFGDLECNQWLNNEWIAGAKAGKIPYKAFLRFRVALILIMIAWNELKASSFSSIMMYQCLPASSFSSWCSSHHICLLLNRSILKEQRSEPNGFSLNRITVP